MNKLVDEISENISSSELKRIEKYLDKILNKGAEKANNLATKKVNEMKNLMGF